MDINISSVELAKYLDTSLIEPHVSSWETRRFIENIKKYPFAAIAADLYYTPLAVELLKDTDIKVVTTIAYPLGGLTTKVKVFHAEEAIKKGADELDVGINLGALKSKNYKEVEKDFSEVVKVADGRTVKAVIFCSFLSDDEIIEACKIAQAAGATFIKTNAGYGSVTELRHVELIRSRISKDELKIMVAGGVRTKNQAVEFLNAGADRIATSHPEKVLGIMQF